MCEASLFAGPLHENLGRCRGVPMTTLGREQFVFIVDDEPKVCEAICDTLEKAGVKVATFGSAAECIEHLRDQKCDLLITDLKMPQMDGVELLTQARMITPWLPVLIITGYGDIPTAVKAVRAGAVDFIEKPLSKDDFVRQVEAILAKSGRINPSLGVPLTRSEKRVLQLIVDGRSNKEIADLLHRSIRTIEVHRSRLMRKIGAENLVDLLKRAATMGLVDLPTGQRRPEIAHEPEESL